MPSQNMSRCVAVAVMLAGSGMTAVGLAPSASAIVLANQPVGVDHCQPNTGQDCPQAPEVHFTVPLGDDVAAYFTANPGHCSDINVRFVKDDPTTGWYPASEWQRVGPGQTVSSGIDVGSGAHTIRVYAQGIEGGCNTGHLDGWGGTVRVESKPGAPLDPNQPVPQPSSPGAPLDPNQPVPDQHASQGPFDPPGSDDLHVP